MPDDVPRTCLFSGVSLTPLTREEHTIPRSLGGRIRSRIVTSDQFNNDCGSYLDVHLKQPYALIVNKLAPLMAGEHSSGMLDVHVPDEKKGIALEPGGAATRRGLTVLSRDPITNRPKTVVSDDAAKLEKLAKQLGKEDAMELTTVPATVAGTFYRGAPVVLAELEIAALKCSLLSFDHALRNAENAFTRSDALREVRGFIAKAVNTRSIDGALCNRYSLGMQYDRLEMYRRIRKRLPFPESEFEHMLLVASHQPSRCLDLVWLIFGFDPFGFRLSYAWDGHNIAFGIVNGVLRNQTASEALQFSPEDDLLCGPTLRRSFPNSIPEENERDQIIQEIGHHRNEAFSKAVMLVEMRADDLLRDNFIEAAALSQADQKGVLVQVSHRLMRMFGRKKEDPSFLRQVDAVVKKHMSTLSPEVASQCVNDADSAADVNWTTWIAFYRTCLLDLTDVYGLPGDVFVNATATGTERAGSRRLGELPGIIGKLP